MNTSITCCTKCQCLPNAHERQCCDPDCPCHTPKVMSGNELKDQLIELVRHYGDTERARGEGKAKGWGIRDGGHVVAQMLFVDRLMQLVSTRDEWHQEVLSTKNLAIRELYEALEMMFEQYCPNGEHQFMMAGEVSEELLDKYKPLVDELISKGEVK